MDMQAQGAVEIGAIVLSSIGMMGGIFMAIIKTIEKNGSIVKCQCCCGSCECDLRQPETRQMVAKLEMERMDRMEREMKIKDISSTRVSQQREDSEEMIEIDIS